MSDTATQFVIYSVKHSRAGQVLFWRPKSCGYTPDLDQAGRFDEAEARAICKDGETALPVPETDLERFSFRRVVNLDVDLNHSILDELIAEARTRLSQP